MCSSNNNLIVKKNENDPQTTITKQSRHHLETMLDTMQKMKKNQACNAQHRQKKAARNPSLTR